MRTATAHSGANGCEVCRAERGELTSPSAVWGFRSAEGFASTADAVRHKVAELGGRSPDDHHPANRAEAERELKQFRDELSEFMVRPNPSPPPHLHIAARGSVTPYFSFRHAAQSAALN